VGDSIQPRGAIRSGRPLIDVLVALVVLLVRPVGFGQHTGARRRFALALDPTPNSGVPPQGLRY
jgi:hypothetical protein